MVWLMDALTGATEDNDDESVESGDDVNESSERDAHERQGTLQTDLSELKQSFSKHLMGVASFLAGDDIVAASSTSNVTTTGESSKHAEISARDAGDSGEAAPLLGSTTTDIKGGKSSESISDDAEVQAVKLAGVKHDLAEFKETVTSGLSQFSAVLGMMTGDDILPRFDRAKGKLSETLVPEHGDTATGAGRAQSQEQVDGSARSAFSLASGIGSISKLASDFLAFNVDNSEDEDGERGGEDLGAAVGLTDEVLAFANNVAAHPETWLDFPLPESESDKDFELSEAQEGHVRALEFHSARLVALRMELCPVYMTEERFWKIYFVLLHSRLHPDDAALLSTPQIVAARRQVLENLRKRSANAVVEAEEDEGPEGEAVTVSASDAQPDEDPVTDAVDGNLSKDASADKEAPAKAEKSAEPQPGGKPEGAAAPSEKKIANAEDLAAKKSTEGSETSSGVHSAPVQSVAHSPVAAPADVALPEKASGESAAPPVKKSEAAGTPGKGAKGGATAGEDDEVDDWLDDAGERDGSDGTDAAEEEDEDVSFSDLEDEEEDNNEDSKGAAKTGLEKGGQALGGKKGEMGWVQLEKGGAGADEDSASSSPSMQGSRGGKGGSPSGDSAEWLKVNALDEASEQH